MKQRENRKLTWGLFIFYLLALVWIILFKMNFSLNNFGHIRGVNLIPFAGSAIINGKIDANEIINNVLVFVPFGIYICMLKSKWSFVKKIIPIAGMSLIIEILQYIFALGATDITDLIGNTLGGVIGIGIYFLFLKIFKNTVKTNKIINILAVIGTVFMAALIAILIIAN